MRQAHHRTLAAQGIEVKKSLRAAGLEVYQATDRRGSELLIFCGAVLGPSWVSMSYILELHGITHSRIVIGNTYFSSEDTEELRELLKVMLHISRQSFREEVFIQDVGFLSSEVKKKFDLRVLLAPATICLITVVIAATLAWQPVAESAKEEPKTLISCALDLADIEFRSWLEDQLSSMRRQQTGQIVIETQLGIVTLEIGQALGSTQLVTGTLNCQDGRSIELAFRTDSQTGGELVEIGQRLNP